MSLCCNIYTNLGCVDSCEPLTIAVAGVTGDYTAYLDFNGGLQKFIIPGVQTEDLILDTPFNENYLYHLKVYLPDGTLLGCYKFQTKLIKNE